MITLTPLQKEEKKLEETQPIFGSSYLRNACHDLVEF